MKANFKVILLRHFQRNVQHDLLNPFVVASVAVATYFGGYARRWIGQITFLEIMHLCLAALRAISLERNARQIEPLFAEFCALGERAVNRCLTHDLRPNLDVCVGAQALGLAIRQTDRTLLPGIPSAELVSAPPERNDRDKRSRREKLHSTTKLPN